MFRLKSALAPLVCASFLVWTPATAWSQDLDELEDTFQEVAEHAIPRTVLVRAIVGPGKQGAGSGAIISPDGYILTCSHVIEIGDRIEVQTADGQTYEAEVLGRNERQDYALLKVDAQGLPHFEVAEDSSVTPGDWVLALGHPGGPYEDLQPAFAAGKVRGLDARLPVGMMSKYYNQAIITDCPIFAGDSGGPLVDLDGDLVGINGAIVMINELAFAIPIEQIMAKMDQLEAGEVIAGEPPGPQAFRDMQKLISPEDYQRMMQRAMGNMGDFFGEDSPLSKLFGEDSPFGDMFGGEGEGNPFGDLFGGGQGEGNPFGDLFGGGDNGEMPDLGELFGGGQGEGNPFGDLFGGEDGQGPDLSKLFEQFQDMFGGENGEAPDMGKMMEDLFGEDGPFGGEGSPFGGEGSPFGGENPFGGEGSPFGGGNPFGGGQPDETQPRESQGPKPFLGLRAAQGGEEAQGILVDSVLEDGPSAGAGVRRGDVIVAIDGEPTPDLPTLKRHLRGASPGDEVTLTVERAVFVDTVLVEREIQLPVTLGRR